MKNYQIFKVISFLLPLFEIAGFIIVGSWIGVLPTLLLIICTTILGFIVLRFHGFITLLQVQRRVQAGEHPTIDVLNSTLLLLGGLLLVFPGFITDIIGLLLLIPMVRHLVLHWLVAKKIILPGVAGLQGNIIEGEFHQEKDSK